MMESCQRGKLLQRYRDAADAIATAFPLGMEARNEERAMEKLLGRQSRRLLRLMEAERGEHTNLEIPDETLLKRRLDLLTYAAKDKMYAYRFDQLPVCWHWLYTNSMVLTSYFLVASPSANGPGTGDEARWDEVVEILDRVLITSGGQSQVLGEGWVEETMKLVGSVIDEEQEADERPRKRLKTSGRGDFSTAEPHGRPHLRDESTCPRHKDWTLDRFEKYMNDTKDIKPVVFTDLISHWPAFDDRSWKSIDYLLGQTLGGRRLVPVEVGRSYVDEGWGQEVIPFKAFLDKYILNDPHGDEYQVGYLAQHNLFRQIPSLRNDIQIPDFCWADVPGHPLDPTKNHPTLDTPQLNAWLGPGKTITPLHTDGYHNLLCQVVGHKYVRLYPPSATEAMMPMKKEDGVDMSNTATVDVGVLEGWDGLGEEWEEDDLEKMREAVEGVEYWECILGPGDTLLIPIGWWHYVRSLSVSFSVSFWWN